jgi:lipase chaperone LimK
MDAAQELDRAKIEEAFRIMGKYLLDRNALGEIAIYGGSAILFQFDWRRSSQDVDARIISAGTHGLVTAAAEQAAQQLDLPRSWMNESVAMYARRLEQDGDRIFVGVYPTPGRIGLRVVAAKPTYILAMKLGALERSTVDDRDFQDAVNLGAACGVATVQDIRDIYQKFFADQELPAAAELRLSELVRAIGSLSRP